jgi:hypothetical protein
MVAEPSHVKQLSLIHVCKIGLSGNIIDNCNFNFNIHDKKFAFTALENLPVVLFVLYFYFA